MFGLLSYKMLCSRVMNARRLLDTLRLWHVIQSFSPSSEIRLQMTKKKTIKQSFSVLLFHRNLILLMKKYEKLGVSSFGHISQARDEIAIPFCVNLASLYNVNFNSFRHSLLLSLCTIWLSSSVSSHALAC
ncbi:unnamed protein product [Cuscuta epithymum]|uniref:Uncharacterized protein n=1 Tax=Cuscuta epithymum TaxID=186058 RepID=A0AAV0BVF2_9ASTE|nr:unnamed protein product [Cuscuta epithymum]